MPESKQIPEIKRLQGGIILPYKVQQTTRMNEDDVQETFYKFNRIKLDQQLLPSLSEAAQHIWRQLQIDLHNYIYAHYDQGSQSTIQMYTQKADRQGRSDIVAECDKVMNWIDTCLAYYYNKKNNIHAAADETSLISITWNFKTDVPITNDLLSLKSIGEMFS
jgi:hypothetical protein